MESWMDESRRSFLKTACTSGFCCCVGAASTPRAGNAGATDPQAHEDALAPRWVAALLPAIAAEVEPEAGRRALKAAAAAHYAQLHMDDRVAGFDGKLDDFLEWLRSEWGWKIDHEPGSGTITIDEAKSYCVCPLVPRGADTTRLGTLCSCSEGFAERLFAAVVGHPVRAEVTQSVLRGATSCMYRITL
jgi:hypothetical protein